MKLKLVKGIWESEGQKFIIIFIKNGEKYPIYTTNIAVFNKWKEALRNLVLCCDFHNEYTVTK